MLLLYLTMAAVRLKRDVYNIKYKNSRGLHKAKKVNHRCPAKEKEKIMARYTGPTNKLFRNYGVKDLSNRKLTSSMRQTASGQHGAVRK